MTDIPKELVERMAALIRKYAKLGYPADGTLIEALAIAKDLPPPPDTDEESAISIAADMYGARPSDVSKDSSFYIAALAGIKRGRELERSGK